MAALDDGAGKFGVFRRHFLARDGVHFRHFGFASIDHQQILHGLLLIVRLDRRHIQSNGRRVKRQLQDNCFWVVLKEPYRPASASLRFKSLTSSKRFVTSRMTATVPATSPASSRRITMVNSTEMRRPSLVRLGTERRSP